MRNEIILCQNIETAKHDILLSGYLERKKSSITENRMTQLICLKKENNNSNSIEIQMRIYIHAQRERGKESKRNRHINILRIDWQ